MNDKINLLPMEYKEIYNKAQVDLDRKKQDPKLNFLALDVEHNKGQPKRKKFFTNYPFAKTTMGNVLSYHTENGFKVDVSYKLLN